MSSRIQGQVTVGSKPTFDVTVPDEGVLVATQRKTITFDATLVQDSTFYVPLGSEIVDVIVDVNTAYNSATSATLSAGTASGGTTYVSGVNAKTAARARPTFTAAQCAALKSTTTGTVVVTVTSVGQPTAGSLDVTLLYKPASN